VLYIFKIASVLTFLKKNPLVLRTITADGNETELLNNYIALSSGISINYVGYSTQSPLLTWLSRSSFGKQVWFTESHLFLVKFFSYVLFIHFILDIK